MGSAQLGVGTDEPFVRLQACTFGRGQSQIEVSEDVVARLSLAELRGAATRREVMTTAP